MVAVAAGHGLWAGVTAGGDAITCVFPCLRLAHLPYRDSQPSAMGRLMSNATGFSSVAVGHLSLFLVSSDGQVFGAAVDDAIRGDGVPASTGERHSGGAGSFRVRAAASSAGSEQTVGGISACQRFRIK